MVALAASAVRSGFNYSLLESDHLEGYVALYGKYKSQREGFTYDVKQDFYLCKQGKKLINKGVKTYGGYFNYYYFSSESDCRDCPILRACCGKSSRKKLTVSAFRNHFDRMENRLKSSLGLRMKRLRMSTVEPVFGSLINYFGLKRINAKGIKAAHKCMVMSATAYNLKKYLKFLKPRKVEVKYLALRKRAVDNCRLLLHEISLSINLQLISVGIHINL